jgi:uncharacterized protein YjiK
VCGCADDTSVESADRFPSAKGANGGDAGETPGSLDVVRSASGVDAATGVDLSRYALAHGPVRVEGVRDNLSGIAWNAKTGTLWAVVNGPSIVLELTTEGEVLRGLWIENGGDTEGITILDDGRLAICAEDGNRIDVHRQPDAEDGALKRDPAPTISVLPGAYDNVGIEGVAFDPGTRAFYCVKELADAQLLRVSLPSASEEKPSVERLWTFAEKEIEAFDASGCHFDPATGHLLVVSDQLLCVIEVTTDGKEVSRMSVPAPQAEGVTMDDQRRIFVVSEPNLLYRFDPPHTSND